MKRGLFVILSIGILLLFPIVQAQTYSGLSKLTDNVKLLFSSGDKKVRLMLEIREKQVNSAIEKDKEGDYDSSVKDLEKAWKNLQTIQEEVSSDTSEEVQTSVVEVIETINKEDLSEDFDLYVLEEEKTQLTAVLIQELFEYCKGLADEDYVLMLKEEKCNPDNASPGLQKELEELRKLQEESFIQLMLDIRSCVDDPGTCNCDDISDMAEKAKCEKMIALAVKCEYNDDQEACTEMNSLMPAAESFVPDSLKDLFKKYESMIDYNIEKSDVPPECYNENTKPECEQYMYMKETRAKCWNKDGSFNYEECGGPKAKEPTMQESIPQCYDEDGNFLEEKCGKITIVINEEGLVNYIIEKEIDTVIENFENSSEQHLVEVNQSSTNVEQANKVWEIEEGINEVDDNIQNWVVEVEEGSGGNLKRIIEKDVSVSSGDGNNVVENVVKSGNGEESTTVSNEVAGVDEGPGEPGVVDED